MAPTPALPRLVIEDDSYKSGLAQLKISYRAIDRAFEKLSYAVATRPEIFPQVPGTEYRRVRINGFQHMPDLNVWFTYDDQCVILRLVEVFDSEEL